jgi:hypothetical protein
MINKLLIAYDGSSQSQKAFDFGLEMGHRGESLIQKWLLGSVAKRVLSYAHCTIIIVR